MKAMIDNITKRVVLTALILSLAAVSFGVENQITSVTPDQASQGTISQTVTFTLDTDVPPAPPAGVMPQSVMIGSISGTSVTHSSQYTLTAVFDIPSNEALGSKDVNITFTTPQGFSLVFSKAGGFTVISGADMPPTITQHPQSQTPAQGSSVTFSVTAYGTDPLSYQWQKDSSDISDATGSSYTIALAAKSDEGDYQCVVTNDFGSDSSDEAALTLATTPPYVGYNLLSPLGSTDTFLMDNDGIFVHSWTSAYGPGNAVYLLEDGTLMRCGNTRDTTFDAGGAGGIVQQYNWDGDLLWSFQHSTDSYRLHHDVEVLPNGNILMIAWQLKTETQVLTAGRNPSLLTDSELWPDYIIEVQPTGSDGGNIVWQWNVWDHLVQDYDSAKENYGVVADNPQKINLNFAINGNADWNHINSIDYNAQLDQIVLSVRNFSEIWIIDHNTTVAEAATEAGDLLYRWGNPQAYGAGDSSDQQLFVQHDAKWIESGLPGVGDILIFNNGQGRSDGNYSTVDQITPPIDTDGSYTLQIGSTYAPQLPDWTYTSNPAADFYAMNISGAQRLANGNTLVCQGPDGLFFEVTSQGDKVWEYDYDGQVFRIERYALDYPGFIGTELEPEKLPESGYPIVDTAQDKCYDNSNEITPPAQEEAFYGQDAQFDGNQPSYTLSGDGLTVTDNVTGLIWTQTADIDGDGDIDADDKLTYAQAIVYPDTLNDQNFAGYGDWRLPSIKELYSLMDFRGQDPSGVTGNDTFGLTPFIDTDYFGFGYGDTTAGERIIDAQWASSTLYVSTTMGGNATMFGLNLADGRIKGYPKNNKTYYVYFVRGNTDYGVNNFVDNDDGIISDKATGLMWDRNDSGDGINTGTHSGMNWEDTLAWVQTKNADNHLGYNNWRLPNAKEMQSIIDYTRSPDTTGSAAIDPIFNTTQITNEAGLSDYPWFWTGTTHANSNGGGSNAAYICFGRALGYWNGAWEDVHGAGCQRSDPKSGDPADWPTGHGPQGDAIRIYNYVRLVRDTQCGQFGYVSSLDGDLNADCYVNLFDLAILAQGWQSTYEMTDLAVLAQMWLDCIAPQAPCNYLP